MDRATKSSHDCGAQESKAAARPWTDHMSQNTDFAFANEVRAAVDLKTPRTARLLLFWSLGLVAVGLIWAHFAVLDEVKRGNGKVIPSRQMQVVQTLEGGIVTNILVREGAI